MTERGKMRLYGAGGAGVNIASFFDKADNYLSSSIGAEIHVAYIDTSRSNIKSDIDQEKFYTLEGVDGSGKIRSENANQIAENVKQMLLKHPPMDLNVLVFSGAGGSGSVINPLLVKELLNQQKSVVCLVINSSESVITTQNSIKTLKTLEAISHQTNKPVVAWTAYNQEAGRSSVDADARAMIGFLSILCSKQIAEMDSRDLANWLQFDRTTQTKPCLASLFAILSADQEHWTDISPISISSIYPDPDAITISVIPEYQSTGYADLSGHRINELHLAIDPDHPRLVFNELNTKLQDMLKTRDSKVQPKTILDQNEKPDDNGLIL